MSCHALVKFGYTPREAEWLHHVLVHAGAFLRRQYLSWIGDRKRGAVDQRLLAGLLRREHATAWPYHRREMVYHLTNKALYAAIDAPDLRHRRPLPPYRLAQKLMLLDLTIREPEHRWLATETDKVRFFLDSGVPVTCLPQRVYQSGSALPNTTRHFVDRFPILIDREGRVGLVYPDFSGHGDPFAQFLEDHARLFERQPNAEVVYLTSRDGAAERAEVLFRRQFGLAAQPDHALAAEFLEYCGLRQAYETSQYGAFGSGEWARFDAARRRFSGMDYENLYRTFVTAGPTPALVALHARTERPAAITFRHVALPHRYYCLGRAAVAARAGGHRAATLEPREGAGES